MSRWFRFYDDAINDPKRTGCIAFGSGFCA
jgi:hypothetical protein